MQLSILDDYQGVALANGNWDKLRGKLDIKVERAPFASEDAAAAALADSEIVVAMRERTPFPRSLVERLPKLKLLVTTGARNASFDLAALKDHGVTVCGTGGSTTGTATAELTWALILGAARHIGEDHRAMRDGAWQTRIGVEVGGKTLGIVGLGKLGGAVAEVAKAFKMKVIAWSPNLKAERAAELGVEKVEKAELFRRADFVTIHLVLSARSRGTVGREDIALMKPDAILVNTSRGPLVDTEALVEALQAGKLGYAALDVYDHEPLPADDKLRRVPNLLLTPHVGYVTRENYKVFYADAVANVLAFLDGKPVRLIS